jgi:phytoene synthase
LRPAFDALYAIDDAMGDVVAQSTQPALGAIKLAWWRERLEELDQGKVPAEPRLQAAATELQPRGVSGAELSSLEDGWLALLEQPAEAVRALNRGAMLFRLAARLIDDAPPDLSAAGRLYARGSLRRRGVEFPDAEQLAGLPAIPARFRCLTGLAALARRDLRHIEAEGTPGRAWTLLRLRLTGRC